MEETVGRKLCRALKYTSASVLLLVVLILLGIFLPFETSTLERGFGQYMEDSWLEFKTSEGVFEMIVFLMNSIRYYFFLFHSLLRFQAAGRCTRT